MMLTSAGAICIAELPRTVVRTRRGGRRTPIRVDATWGHGEALAERLRIRGPDGALVPVRTEVHGTDVRMVPSGRWARGTHVVEERGAYGPDGALDIDGEGSDTTWFPLAPFVVGRPPGRIDVSRVAWHDDVDLGARVIRARVPAGPRVEGVELEVRGVGPIARSTRANHGAFTLWSGAPVPCNDTLELQPIPPGSLRVRVRAFGADGREGTSPWVRLGEGVPADVSGLVGWRAHPMEPDERPTATGIPCGTLALGELVRTPLPAAPHPDAYVARGPLRLPWSEGTLVADRHGLVFEQADGRTTPLLPNRYVQAWVEDGRAWVGGQAEGLRVGREVHCTGVSWGLPARWPR